MHWQFWLIDGPAKLTDIGQVWLRLYLFVIFAIFALIGPLTVATVLVLWFGFGIRWGW